MKPDWKFSLFGGEGVEVYAAKDGLAIGGWCDTHVAIDGGLLSWEVIDQLRQKAKRRKPWHEVDA